MDYVFLTLIVLMFACLIYKLFTVRILFQRRLGEHFYYIRVGLSHYRFTRHNCALGVVYKHDAHDFSKAVPIADKKLAEYLTRLINDNFPPEGRYDPTIVVSRVKRWLRKFL